MYAQGWWNYSFGQPQQIPVATNNTQPEYDFVFDYTYANTYQFNLHLIMAGSFDLFGPTDDHTLIRTTVPLTFNNAYPTTPPTGIKSGSKSDIVSVYPNPFNNDLVIKTKTNALNSKYTISNVLGMTVSSGIITNETMVLNLEKLNAGLYTLNIDGANKQSVKISKR